MKPYLHCLATVDVNFSRILLQCRTCWTQTGDEKSRELRRIIEGWYLCAYRKVRVYLLGGKRTSLDGDLNLHQQFVPIQPCYFIHVLGDLHRILQMLHWVDCPCSFYLILAWQPNLDWDFMAGHIRRCSSTWAVFDWKRRGGFLNCNVCLRWWPHQYCHLQVELSLVVEFIYCYM